MDQRWVFKKGNLLYMADYPPYQGRIGRITNVTSNDPKDTIDLWDNREADREVFNMIVRKGKMVWGMLRSQKKRVSLTDMKTKEK
jgi:hypothetical protein